MKSILDPSFHYVPSTQTDIRKTFSRVRREIARAKAAQSGRSQSLVVMLPRKREVATR